MKSFLILLPVHQEVWLCGTPAGVRVHKVCCCWTCPQTHPLRRSTINQLRHQSHIWPARGPQVHWSPSAVGVPLMGPEVSSPLGTSSLKAPGGWNPAGPWTCWRWGCNGRPVPALHVGIKALLWWTLALSCLYSKWQPRPYPRHSQTESSPQFC